MLSELLNGVIKQQVTNMVAQKLGLNPQVAAAAVNFALPLLLNGISKNASNQEGANALHSALTKDHDGSILNNLAGFVQNSEQGPGAGILKHVLGSNQDAAANLISSSAGIDAGQASQVMQILAPVLMGTLGSETKQQGFDASALSGMVRNAAVENNNQGTSDINNLISTFLDKNKDGNVMDDAMNMIGGFLGKK